MPKQNVALLGFNRGQISPLALARTDLQRTAWSAESMVNWIPRVFGNMMLRPGLEYIGDMYGYESGGTIYSEVRLIPFVFATDDVAIIEISRASGVESNSYVRIWVNDDLITRNTVSTLILEDDFSGLTNWTDNDESGATSDATYGFLRLLGTGSARAIRTQQIIVGAGDDVETGLKIVVCNGGSHYHYGSGPVTLRIGTSSGGDDILPARELVLGNHQLTFTPPTGAVYIQLESILSRPVFVSECSIVSGGYVYLLGPWSYTDFDNIRYEQSGDIVYCACKDVPQHKIIRWGDNAWSMVVYQPEDGPFDILNTTSTTITPSALTGSITLTATQPIFNVDDINKHNGFLYKLIALGQDVTKTISAENTFSDAIKVTNVGTQRAFTISISGSFTATVRTQRSVTADTGPWEDVGSWAAATTTSYNDGLDNQTVWYRIGVKTGEFTTGPITVTLRYSVGTSTGVVRVTEATDEKTVYGEVLEDLGGTSATDYWQKCQWNDTDGWPTAVALSEGRLWWSGKNGIWGSVSDDYEGFSDDVVGDSGVINRTIGIGPVDVINWIIPLQRLLIGSPGNEFVAKSSSLDEPLTPTNFNIKVSSNQGSSGVQAVRLDKSCLYVQRGGTRIFEISTQQDGEYGSVDITTLCPEITTAGVKRIAIQRQPETRIHCVLDDGTVALAIYDKNENVLSWQSIETDGDVLDVCILPRSDGTTEDAVYYATQRNIDGYVFLEKWSLESDCQGSTLNKQADSFTTYSGVSTSTITGLNRLEGKTVVVWGNGKDLGSYTVSGGSITLTEAVTSAIIGLSYTAQWKSSKLAYAAGLGTALTQKKRISQLGVILRNTHYQGLKYGKNFTTMYNLPLVSRGAITPADTVHSVLDSESFSFPGDWDTDSRLFLQAQAPRPCSILAGIISVETHDKY